MTLLLYHTPAQERGISVPVASFIPRDRSLGGDAFFLLDLLLARRPLVLQFLVQREPVHVLGPPLAPARQEHLLRVLGNVVPEEGSQQVRTTYNSQSIGRLMLNFSKGRKERERWGCVGSGT